MNTNAIGITIVSLVVLCSSSSTAHATNVGQMPDWFGARVERDRHTTLIARFDDGVSCDADYSRGDHRANGLWFDPHTGLCIMSIVPYRSNFLFDSCHLEL